MFRLLLGVADKAVDRDPDGTPSHTELETRLIRAGLITRPLRDLPAAAERGLFDGLDLSNGDAAVIDRESKSAGPVQIASFPC